MGAGPVTPTGTGADEAWYPSALVRTSPRCVWVRSGFCGGEYRTCRKEKSSSQFIFSGGSLFGVFSCACLRQCHIMRKTKSRCGEWFIVQRKQKRSTRKYCPYRSCVARKIRLLSGVTWEDDPPEPLLTKKWPACSPRRGRARGKDLDRARNQGTLLRDEAGGATALARWNTFEVPRFPGPAGVTDTLGVTPARTARRRRRSSRPWVWHADRAPGAQDNRWSEGCVPCETSARTAAYPHEGKGTSHVRHDAPRPPASG